ncbi:hypothetical protein M2137_001862 [Parabacteroides sp. PFB2-10]|uniref:hypothetical protein n=1 Tax=Parabacteroides sp. PFB2-10 TaxID=1742405 RepID=UPI0024744A9F|nr:hypothetical protein [Parabacteroides sp. PFB2-10]MDH6313075.1 hypothetical protein [Parabacteroides sp. PFB2-10]MDL2245014.1 hypothetical protein [Parabacteroides sp. OttesenSCG-928-J18]
MKKYLFFILAIGVLISSCSNEERGDSSKKNNLNLIKSEPISTPLISKSFDSGLYSEAYRCSSEASNVVADIFVDEDHNESVAFLLSSQGDVVHEFHFKVDSYLSDYACEFTGYNELGEPLMSGIFDIENQFMQITDVYGNVVFTKASAAAWGCGLSIGLVGAIWSTAAGMVSAGAGFVVGMSYTAMAIAVCDGL